MRNKLSDIEYAIGEDGKGGNKAFRITFLGYTDRNITKIAFEKEFSGTLNIENEKPNIENEKPNRLQRETLNERILKKPQL